jgi:hypothetical protein
MSMAGRIVVAVLRIRDANAAEAPPSRRCSVDEVGGIQLVEDPVTAEA